MQASDLARRLAEQAETVCRHYLSNGRRSGSYWIVGDVRNTPGRSMFVRLKGPVSGKGAAGKWTDAATGEHGDLLDVIRESCGLGEFGDVLAEARRFLSLPRSERKPESKFPIAPAPVGSPESARNVTVCWVLVTRSSWSSIRSLSAARVKSGSIRLKPCWPIPKRWR